MRQNFLLSDAHIVEIMVIPSEVGMAKVYGRAKDLLHPITDFEVSKLENVSMTSFFSAPMFSQ